MRAVAALTAAWMLAFALPCAGASTDAAASTDAGASTRAGLAGRWVVNDLLTRELQPPDRGPTTASGGLPRPSISVGGMPIPGTTPAAQPGIGGSAPDPMVLRCTELTLAPAGDTIELSFHGVGSDRLQRGRHQGVVSRWSERKLTTHYDTTSRRVSQTYEVDRDDRLVVTVKLNPKQGKTLVHKRVFDRLE
jgi:hypothetical protein